MVKKRRQVSKKFIPQASIVSDELYIPNHSGQLDAGTFSALTDGSVLFAENNKLAQNNSNLFWNVGRTQLETNLLKITSDGTQAAPALKFNDTNTGFFKSGDSVRFSLNNNTKLIFGDEFTVLQDLVFSGSGTGLPFAEIYARDNTATTSTSTTKTQVLIFIHFHRNHMSRT